MKRKANLAFFGLAFGIFIAVSIILFNLQSAEPNVDYVGQTANTVLENVEQQQQSFLDLDQRMESAMQQAAKQTVLQNGIKNPGKCQKVGYNVLGGGCEFAPKDVFDETFEDSVQNLGRSIKGLEDENVPLSTGRDGWTVSVDSETGMLFTVDSVRKVSESQQIGTTAFGEPVVSIQDIDNVQCDDSKSCTGFQKQCAVEGPVYNQLEKFAAYAEKHDLSVFVRSTTRSVKMQQYFEDAQQFCQRRKASLQACDNGTDNTADCRNAYKKQIQGSQRAEENDACNSDGTCNPACDPRVNGRLNKGCTHITGNAIDIGVYDGAIGEGDLINKDPDLQRSMRRTLCEFGFVNYYPEIWHYEYKSPRWKELQRKDSTECTYAGGTQVDWASVPLLHEKI